MTVETQQRCQCAYDIDAGLQMDKERKTWRACLSAVETKKEKLSIEIRVQTDLTQEGRRDVFQPGL